MAAENYWRFADARQQQAMVAAAAAAAGWPHGGDCRDGRPGRGGHAPQAAMAQQAAAAPLKRARPDYGGSSVARALRHLRSGSVLGG